MHGNECKVSEGLQEYRLTKNINLTMGYQTEIGHSLWENICQMLFGRLAKPSYFSETCDFFKGLSKENRAKSCFNLEILEFQLGSFRLELVCFIGQKRTKLMPP